MKKRIVLGVLLVGILFPFASLMQFSKTYASLFSQVFDSRLSHIVMHGALFAALSLCVLSFMPGNSPRQQVWITMMIILGVALVQETIQVVTNHSAFNADTLFDLGVDLTASVAAILIFIGLKRTTHLRAG